MKTFIQDGKIVNYTNSGSALSAGDPVVIGGLLGAAVGDIANGATGPVRIAEVVRMTKVTATVVAAGDQLDFDVSEQKLDVGITPASGDLVGCGTAVAAADGSSTTVDILLNVPGATVTP
jgi:predicted RecA/RadA family phage recombinase